MNMPLNHMNPRRNEYDFQSELESAGRGLAANYLKDQASQIIGSNAADALIDQGFGTGSTAVRALRKGTVTTDTMQFLRVAISKPQHYVPYGERKAAIATFKAKTEALKQRLERLPGVWKMTDKVLAENNIPRPWINDPHLSKQYDVYKALCEELGVPLGTLIDRSLYSRAFALVRGTGMSDSQIAAALKEKGIRGDAKDSYLVSDEFVLQNPNSRMYNVSYENRVKGAAMTALRKIPYNTTNLNTVLNATPVDTKTEEQKKSEEETKAASNLTRNLLIVGGLSAVVIGSMVVVKRSRAKRA